MGQKQVWMITGAARGMGVDFTKAALAAGHAVVATGRRPEAVAEATGPSDDLLVCKLDVTIAAMEPPPRRFIAGADSIAVAEQRIADLQAQVDALRELSTGLAI